MHMQFIKTFSAFLIFFIALSNNVLAAEKTAENGNLETAKKLVNLFDMEQTYKEMIGPMSANISALIIKNQPCLAPFKDDVRDVSRSGYAKYANQTRFPRCKS